MPDSNRGYRLALVGALIAFGLTCFGCGLYLASLPEPEYQRGAPSSASSNPSDSPQPASQVSGATPSPASNLQPSPEEQTNYAREDLKAQRVMAWWTRIMGVAAAVGIALGAVSIWLIWQTWDAMRGAADNSRQTLHSYIYRERAILRFTSARFQFLNDLPLPAGFQAHVINHGPSPAELGSVEWEYLDGPVWPKKLRFEKFTSTVVTNEEYQSTPHLDWDGEGELPIYLAVRLNYATLGTEMFSTFKAYKISCEPDDGISSGGYYAEAILRIAEQPFDT